MGSEENEELVGKTPDVAHKPVKVTVRKMLSMLAGTDWLYLFCAMFFAAGGGCAMATMMLIISDLLGENATMGVEIAMGTKTIEDLFSLMLHLARLLAVVACCFIVCGFFFTSSIRMLRHNQSSKFRHMYLSALLHQDLAWYDGQNIASIPANMAILIDQIGDAYSDTFTGSVQGIFCFMCGYGLSFWRGPQLAGVMCAGLPFVMTCQAYCTVMIKEVQRETQGHYSQAAEVVEESLYAIKTIISLGLEKDSLSRFSMAMEMVRKSGLKVGIKKGLVFGVTWLCLLLTFALCFWYGTKLIYDQTINPYTGVPYIATDVMAVFMCTFAGATQAANIDGGIRGYFRGCMAASTIFTLAENPPSIQPFGGKDTRRTLMNVEKIVFDDVHFAYPTKPDIPVLLGVSIEIKMGQKVAFVGSSGCGKSTSIALIERFYDPVQGRILVNGEDLKSFSIKSVRSVIGYVGQEPVLFAGSIRDNIMNGNPMASTTEVDRVVRQADCTFLHTFPDGLDTDGGLGGAQFSGGQKQRIAIARALLRRPSVLLLDEATSALDNRTERAVLETFTSLIAESSGTLSTVNVAHRLSSIRNCDCIYMFLAGKIAEKGTFRELMVQQGEFFKLAESQTYTDVDVDMSDDEEEEKLPEEKKAIVKGLRRANSKLSDVPKTTIVKKEEDGRLRHSMIGMPSEQPENDKKVSTRRLFNYIKGALWTLPIIWFWAIFNGSLFPFVGLLQVEASTHFAIQDLDEMSRKMRMVWGGYIILAVCMLMSQMILCYLGTLTSETLVKNLRIHLFQNLLRQEVGFHDNPVNTAASLGYALQCETFRIIELLDIIPTNLGVMGSIFTGLALGLHFEWKIVCSFFIFIPIIILSTITMVILMSGVNSGKMPQSAKDLISESVQNPKTVQALCLEKPFIQRYNDVMAMEDKSECQRLKSVGPSAFFSGLCNAMVPLMISFNVWWIGFLVKEDLADKEGLIRSFVSLLWAAQGAGFVAVGLGDSARAQRATRLIFRLIDTKSRIDGITPDGEIPPADFDPGTIEFKRVGFAYPFRPEAQILKGMNFIVHSGQSVGLVGPSGGGKSTIYAMLQRFYDPQDGQVLIGNRKLDLRFINIRYWRGVIGFVGQEPVLFNTTVKQNISYGAADEEVTQAMLDRCVEVANLSFLFEKNGAGFETEVGPKGSRLSGGQKQRVAIARAMIRDPKILLLDEATSALDMTSEKVVSQALEKSRVGRTSFSIAHRLSTVEDCDLILVAGEGLILEQGSDAELMGKMGLYNKLQSLQGRENVCCA